MPISAWIWIAVIIGAIIYELYTALDDFVRPEEGKKTWPLTWVYRKLMCSRLIRTVTFAFFGWMIWHWGIQMWGPWDIEGMSWVDPVFTIVGGLVGFFIGPPKRGVDCGSDG